MVRPIEKFGPSLAIAAVFALFASGCPEGHLATGGEGEGEGGSAQEGEGEGSTGTADGAPTRIACTDSFGSEVSAHYGRLDGILVAVVKPGHGGCRADSTHLHLQIETNNQVSDVAVNLDTLTLQTEHAPVDAWSEGWHTDASFDYGRDLGEHASAFVSHSQSANESALEAALADANHVSIYAKGYGSDGIHDVHRNGGLQDGAIVVRPTESTSLYLLARFSDQSW